MSNVTETLADVQYYTSLDPYYYTVDNRPLKDLDDNIRLVAAASDKAAGGANRSALGLASIAHTLLGFGDLVPGDTHRQAQGVFSGAYRLEGLNIITEHGFMVYPTNIGGDPNYVEPKIATYDTAQSFAPQVGRGGILQASPRVTTVDDRVPADNFDVKAVDITWKQGASPGIFPLPDAGAITLFKVDVPSDATSMLDSYIEVVNYKEVDKTANVLDEAKIGFNNYITSMASGAQNIVLTGTDIDLDAIDAVEVFVEGVNQFDWTFNTVNNQLSLNAPLTEAATVRVRQTTIELG